MSIVNGLHIRTTVHLPTCHEGILQRNPFGPLEQASPHFRTFAHPHICTFANLHISVSVFPQSLATRKISLNIVEATTRPPWLKIPLLTAIHMYLPAIMYRPSLLRLISRHHFMSWFH